MGKLVQRFLLWLLSNAVKGGDIMPIAVIYVALIIEGDKVYKQVPTKVKPEVKRQLDILGYGELVEETQA